MLRNSILVSVLAVAAGFFAFSGSGGAFTGLAKVLFFVFVVANPAAPVLHSNEGAHWYSMKVSELIERLAIIRDEQGDCDVFATFGAMSEFALATATYIAGGEVEPAPAFPHLPRVVVRLNLS